MALTDLSNLRIMIVDSNVFIAKTLFSILEAFNAGKIIVCETIEDAEKVITQTNLDCVFIDFMVEDRRGLGFVKTVRNMAEGKNDKTLPIILNTGLTDMKTIFMARDYGVNEIISKPFSPDQVLLKLDNAINNKREFIDMDEFIGPNRRRHKVNMTDWTGEKDRRSAKPE